MNLGDFYVRVCERASIDAEIRRRCARIERDCSRVLEDAWMSGAMRGDVRVDLVFPGLRARLV